MNTEIYQDIIDGMTWSYSRLKCFEDCPYKWFMTYILEEKEEPMFYSSYGRFVHKLLEMFNLGMLDKEDLPSTFLLGFSEEVQGVRPPARTVAKYLESGVEYFRNFEPFHYNLMAVEKYVTFRIDSLNFVGFIDMLCEKDGELYIIDHKSRNLKQRSNRKKKTNGDQELDEMLKQLYLYAEAVKQIYGEYPKKLMFNCFRENQVIEEDFNNSACDEAKQWALSTVSRIRNATDFIPLVEYFKCRNICGLRSECCYWEEG